MPDQDLGQRLFSRSQSYTIHDILSSFSNQSIRTLPKFKTQLASADSGKSLRRAYSSQLRNRVLARYDLCISVRINMSRSPRLAHPKWEYVRSTLGGESIDTRASIVEDEPLPPLEGQGPCTMLLLSRVHVLMCLFLTGEPFLLLFFNPSSSPRFISPILTLRGPSKSCQ